MWLPLLIHCSFYFDLFVVSIVNDFRGVTQVNNFELIWPLLIVGLADIFACIYNSTNEPGVRFISMLVTIPQSLIIISVGVSLYPAYIDVYTSKVIVLSSMIPYILALPLVLTIPMANTSARDFINGRVPGSSWAYFSIEQVSKTYALCVLALMILVRCYSCAIICLSILGLLFIPILLGKRRLEFLSLLLNVTGIMLISRGVEGGTNVKIRWDMETRGVYPIIVFMFLIRLYILLRDTQILEGEPVNDIEEPNNPTQERIVSNLNEINEINRVVREPHIEKIPPGSYEI